MGVDPMRPTLRRTRKRGQTQGRIATLRYWSRVTARRHRDRSFYIARQKNKKFFEAAQRSSGRSLSGFFAEPGEGDDDPLANKTV